MELGRLCLRHRRHRPFDAFWCINEGGLEAYDRYWVCDTGLRRYFEIPEGVTEVDVVAFSRPARDRLSVSLAGDWISPEVRLDGRRTIDVTRGFYGWIEEFCRDVVYLGVEYDDV